MAMTNKIGRTRIAAGLMALALLAGCNNKSEPDTQPSETENVGADAQPEPVQPEPATPTPEPAPVERPTPVATPIAAEPREPAPSPDAQMLDDADATGMTARITRQESQGNAGQANEHQGSESQGNDAAP
jgi:glucose/arabinose dehydrogenase